MNDYIERGIFSKRSRAKYDSRNPYVALAAEEGIILGRDQNKKQLILLPEQTDADNHNVLTFGSSGASKGQANVLPNLVNIRSQNMFGTDPKGELFLLTAPLKRDQGYAVYQIDFIDFEQSRYNPLDYVFTDVDAQNLSMTIAANSKRDDKEDFFMERAQKMLLGLIVYCKSTNPTTNNDVINIYNAYVAPDEDTFAVFVEDIVGREPTAYQTLKGLNYTTI
ncbi:type IV secretory system conjugative DNA transfer family protein [Oceanobacillus zhaokaii]|uniref:type IV secretory system conjugative DNA transfer family protein n=1 Tax=Oceanobacillus zhaokaii TaxID=2052660 RepID=UPI0013B46EBD|nr:type IV secretory system conjugative DNA transfer family protein [Oceanobacillus zhaokaii]